MTWESFVITLGQSMHRHRISKGMSQEDVAYRAGLSRYTYQRLEQGKSRPATPANPSLRTILAIAQALDVEPGELLPAEMPDLRAGSRLDFQ